MSKNIFEDIPYDVLLSILEALDYDYRDIIRFLSINKDIREYYDLIWKLKLKRDFKESEYIDILHNVEDRNWKEKYDYVRFCQFIEKQLVDKNNLTKNNELVRFIINKNNINMLISDMNILNGLKQFNKINSIIIDGVDLSDLKLLQFLSKFDKIIGLQLINNNLEQEHFELINLPVSLRELSIQNNDIISLPNFKLPNLKYIDVLDCKFFENINECSNYPKLYGVKVNRTNLNKVYIENSKSINDMDLSSNHLSYIHIDLENLEYLDISYNDTLSYLHLNLPSLLELDYRVTVINDDTNVKFIKPKHNVEYHF